MSMTKQDRLEELEAREQNLRDQLHIVITNRIAMEKSIWHDKIGINIGDRVSFIDGGVEKTGTLIELEVHTSWTWPIVLLDKKDGTPGIRKATCYDEKTIKKIV